MKNIFLLFCVYFVSMQLVDAQMTDTTKAQSKELYKFYRQRRKTYNTVGFILVTAGPIMTVAGAAMQYPLGEQNPHRGEALAIAGVVTTLASIPFFIAASHNKRKAKLALGEAGITLNNADRTINNKSYASMHPAIFLSFDFEP